MLTRIFRAAGRHTGTGVSDGVLFDECIVAVGDLTGPAGARMVLTDPRVEIAVLETARGGLLLRGLGYESNDASVVTNVTSDHLDLQGIHTLPELAEVKSTVARVTKPDGVAVLNADDRYVAGMARWIRARVAYFSLVPGGSAAMRRAVAAGALGYAAEDGWLVEMDGEALRRVVEIGRVPVTIGGLARHNVANVMAAAAAA